MNNIVNVLDLEMLCWEKEEGYPYYPEIIEFSFVECSIKEMEIRKKIQYYLKPELGGSISDYCYNLTKITNKKINKSTMTLDKVLNKVIEKNGFLNRPLICWGNDLKVIKREILHKSKTGMLNNYSELKNIEPNNFVNLSLMYNLLNKKNTNISLENAMKEMNLEFKGDKHSGINDALNTAKLLFKIINKNISL